MMRLSLVLAAIVLAVVFAAQNAEVVNLSLLAWNLDASLAVIIVLCFAVGALVAALALMPGIYRSRAEQRKTRQRLAELEYGAKNGIHTSAASSSTASSSVLEPEPAASDHTAPSSSSKAPQTRGSW